MLTLAKKRTSLKQKLFTEVTKQTRVYFSKLTSYQDGLSNNLFCVCACVYVAVDCIFKTSHCNELVL